jgi:hypothetical protein
METEHSTKLDIVARVERADTAGVAFHHIWMLSRRMIGLRGNSVTTTKIVGVSEGTNIRS